MDANPDVQIHAQMVVEEHVNPDARMGVPADAEENAKEIADYLAILVVLELVNLLAQQHVLLHVQDRALEVVSEPEWLVYKNKKRDEKYGVY